MPDIVLVLAYVAAVVAVLTFQYKRRRKLATTIDLTDPYLLAYLKNGAYGVSRAVLARLIVQQKLRQVGHMQLIAATPGAAEPVDELERSAWSAFQEPVRSPAAVATAAGSPQVDAACSIIYKQLQEAGLLHNADVPKEYWLSISILAALLLALYGQELYTRGFRFEAADGWMFVICVVGSIASYMLSGSRSTAENRQLVVEVERRYAGLPELVKSGAEMSAQEIALTAGLFGLTVFGASQLANAAVFKEASRDWSSSSSRAEDYTPDLSGLSDPSDPIESTVDSSWASSSDSSSSTDTSCPPDTSYSPPDISSGSCSSS